MRNALRSFAVDAIERADLLEDETADEVSESRLEKVLGTGYGIFCRGNVPVRLSFGSRQRRLDGCRARNGTLANEASTNPTEAIA